MENTDYQSIRELINSHGWKLICEELDNRINSIVKVLETPTNDDMFGKISEIDAIKQLSLLNYKKAELKYLRELKELPSILLETKIK